MYTNQTRIVYTALQDDLSRFLFEKRVMYSITGDLKYLSDVVFETDECWKTLVRKCNTINDKKVLYGCGLYGRILLNKLHVEYAVDKNADKISNFPIEIIDPTAFFKKYNGEYVILGISPHLDAFNGIRNLLLLNGVGADKIISFEKFNTGYYALPQLNLGKNEVFVDAGVYDGNDTMQFANITNGKYKHIYAFEPDNTSLRNLESIFAKNNINNVTLEKMGLWEEATQLAFTNDGTEGSMISSDAKSIIDVTSLDEYFLSGNPINKYIPTLIKMDIEGSELETLYGAEKLITENKPKLVISVYHKHLDLFEIPSLLLRYNPAYKFYLRKTNISPKNDYVLYAL